mmetsp:Transcript_19272/g.66833  ORF Transcript_19272/g.66833 Transcript_19272/m.66833 type:complete len:822 (-) Transcript_19272:1630-4095(-)
MINTLAVVVLLHGVVGLDLEPVEREVLHEEDELGAPVLALLELAPQLHEPVRGLHGQELHLPLLLRARGVAHPLLLLALLGLGLEVRPRAAARRRGRRRHGRARPRPEGRAPRQRRAGPLGRGRVRPVARPRLRVVVLSFLLFVEDLHLLRRRGQRVVVGLHGAVVEVAGLGAVEPDLAVVVEVRVLELPLLVARRLDLDLQVQGVDVGAQVGDAPVEGRLLVLPLLVLLDDVAARDGAVLLLGPVEERLAVHADVAVDVRGHLRVDLAAVDAPELLVAGGLEHARLEHDLRVDLALELRAVLEPLVRRQRPGVALARQRDAGRHLVELGARVDEDGPRLRHDLGRVLLRAEPPDARQRDALGRAPVLVDAQAPVAPHLVDLRGHGDAPPRAAAVHADRDLRRVAHERGLLPPLRRELAVVEVHGLLRQDLGHGHERLGRRQVEGEDRRVVALGRVARLDDAAPRRRRVLADLELDGADADGRAQVVDDPLLLRRAAARAPEGLGVVVQRLVRVELDVVLRAHEDRVRALDAAPHVQLALRVHHAVGPLERLRRLDLAALVAERELAQEHARGRLEPDLRGDALHEPLADHGLDRPRGDGLPEQPLDEPPRLEEAELALEHDEAVEHGLERVDGAEADRRLVPRRLLHHLLAVRGVEGRPHVQRLPAAQQLDEDEALRGHAEADLDRLLRLRGRGPRGLGRRRAVAAAVPRLDDLHRAALVAAHGPALEAHVLLGDLQAEADLRLPIDRVHGVVVVAVGELVVQGRRRVLEDDGRPVDRADPRARVRDHRLRGAHRDAPEPLRAERRVAAVVDEPVQVPGP